jgi:hypothetical protein
MTVSIPASTLDGRNAGVPSAVEQFRALVTRWRRETGGLSNPHKRLRHPSYRAIVAMGWPAVPLLLNELGTAEDPDMWGPALREITGDQISVSAEDAGRLDVVAKAWLVLAETRGWLSR